MLVPVLVLTLLPLWGPAARQQQGGNTPAAAWAWTQVMAGKPVDFDARCKGHLETGRKPINMPPRCLVWVATASRGADLVFLGSAESRFSAPA